MNHHDQFQTFLSTIQIRINRVLESYIDDLPEDRLREAMGYSLKGGKRVRAGLAYATASMLEIPFEKIDAIAASVEMIHAYSLIHDDLPALDDDDLRRGNPTCHIAFDEATSILAGDALQSLAFQTLINATFPADAKIEILNELVHAAGYSQMILGQSLDLQAENKSISLEELEQIHKLKTGALIEASVIMPCFVALQKSDALISGLRHYAKCIGLAFQVQDDILDIEGHTSELGKPQGSDLEKNKATYPALMGLNNAKSHAQTLVSDAVDTLAKTHKNGDLLCSIAHFIISRSH